MATIYCFTSTGNSLYVAKKIATKMNAELVSMTSKVTETSDTVIGFVFPAYFWGLPKTVHRFVKELAITSENPYIFTVITYGGSIIGVEGAIHALLKEKKRTLAYANKVKMVENYLPSYEVNESDKLWENADKKVETILLDLLQKKRRRAGHYSVLNKSIYHSYPANKKGVENSFLVGDCTGCGLCEKICPNANIRLVERKPMFHNQCELCLACVHSCPQTAIDWTEKTKGKNRYKNSRISQKELLQFIRNVDE